MRKARTASLLGCLLLSTPLWAQTAAGEAAQPAPGMGQHRHGEGAMKHHGPGAGQGMHKCEHGDQHQAMHQRMHGGDDHHGAMDSRVAALEKRLDLMRAVIEKLLAQPGAARP